MTPRANASSRWPSQETFDYPTVDALGKVILREDFNDTHIAQVLALKMVDVEAVRARHFKVVVDAVNSVGGIVIPRLLRQLGCEVVELNWHPRRPLCAQPRSRCPRT